MISLQDSILTTVLRMLQETYLAVASLKTRRLHGLLSRGIKSPARLVIRRPKLYYFTDAKMITARNTDRVRKDFIIFVHP